MRVIGARQVYEPRKDFRVESSDGSTVLTLCRDKRRGSVQIDINGDWLWLAPSNVGALRAWLDDFEVVEAGGCAPPVIARKK